MFKLVFTLVVAAALVSGAAASADPFVGAFVSTDPDDASTLRLEISAAGASGVRHLTVFDSAAGFCDGDHANGHGTGTVTGTTFTGTLTIVCPRGTRLTVDVTAEATPDGIDFLDVTFVPVSQG
jgi:hypothetical protein